MPRRGRKPATATVCARPTGKRSKPRDRPKDYLDRARRTWLRRFTERLDAQMDAHAIERGLRAAWRSYVQEIADWMPQGWHPAVEWCAYLPDLAIIEGLVSRRALPDWAAEDPVFAALIESKRQPSTSGR